MEFWACFWWIFMMKKSTVAQVGIYFSGAETTEEPSCYCDVFPYTHQAGGSLTQGLRKRALATTD